jgi:hypothetical protein
MGIFDRFRKISGEDIYKEICDIIVTYKLRFDIHKEENLKTKDFYNPYYQEKTDNRWFIRLGFGPFQGTVVPVCVEIARHVEVRLNSSGVHCSPIDTVGYVYGTGKGYMYNLHKWKRDKKLLIRALDFSYEQYQKWEYNYRDWLDGSVGWDVIHFESLNRERAKLGKQYGGNDNA